VGRNLSTRRLISSIGRGQLGRRQFLRSLAGLGLSAVGLALLDGCGSSPAAPGAATDNLETTTLTLTQSPPSICIAPQHVAEELLRQEGFTNIRYVKAEGGTVDKSLASGAADMSIIFAAPAVIKLDAGAPITILSGVHIGCFELFGTQGIRAIGDLKGKTIAVSAFNGSQYYFLTTMMTYVGLDPNKDINWVTHPPAEAIQLLSQGKVDAYLAFPPTAQEMRANKIGHVVLNSMVDSPWSQYFCCMWAANQEFMRKNPVATKRALRALLKATDVTAHDAALAARTMVDKQYTTKYDFTVEAIKEIPYNKWRDYDPTDTLRFYALRLRDAGLVKSNPDEIIARGTDWRFLNELKKELPAPVSSVGSSELLCHVGRSGSS
jgi:NitT/TauT family transport system substrate-binding protein